MHQTIVVKLLPNTEQAEALKATMQAFNAGANYVAGEAVRIKTSNKMRLHPVVYRVLRERFGLSAQIAILCIAKVCEAYKRDRTKRPTFREYGAMTHDERTFSFKGIDRVSLLTLRGRVIVPMLFGEYQRVRLSLAKGQADLLFRRGKWLLAATIEIPDGVPMPPTGFLGVDLGIVNLATTSDGEVMSGQAVETVRQRYSTLRAGLQSCGTKSARRHLKKISEKERLFKRHTNHCISKRLVGSAKDTKRGLALESLTGIRSRCTVRRTQRDRHSKWAFAELRAFIDYKAKAAGVPVVIVTARGTSRTCSVCGHEGANNRPSRDLFRCQSCGHEAPADLNAAVNIARRAVVDRPIVSAVQSPPGDRQGQALAV
jgi:IS605 OrfB family transposase